MDNTTYPDEEDELRSRTHHAVNLILLAVLILMIPLAMTFNITSLTVCLTKKLRGNPTTLFIINTCMSDLLAASVCLPLWACVLGLILIINTLCPPV